MFRKKRTFSSSTDKAPPAATTDVSKSSSKPTEAEASPKMASTPQAQTQASVQKTTAATTQPAKTTASDAIVVDISFSPQADATATGSSAAASKGSSQPSASTAASKTTPQSKDQTAAPAAAATSQESQAIKDSRALRKAKGARGFFKRAHTVVGIRAEGAEARRLQEDKERKENWKRWGPYLSERQWATVREDYSPDGSW